MPMFDRHFAHWPKGAPRSLTMPEVSLWDGLETSARRYPEKPALFYYGTAIPYRELRDDAERLAATLAGWGVRKGDRVMLYMQNAPQFVIAYHAILRADAVVVPVNPMSRGAELAHMARDTGARIAICGQELAPYLADCLAEGVLERAVVAAYADYVRAPTELSLPDVVAEPRRTVEGVGLVAWAEAIEGAGAPPPHTAGPQDWALLPYSSGTTGAPKGCLHSHASVMATTFGSVVWYPSSPESVFLATLPLFHVTGMQNSMNAPLFLGATVLLTTRWDRRLAATLIERHRATHWRSITTMAIDFLADPEIERFDLSSLVTIGGGGAQMPRAVAEKLKRLTGLDYIEGYGLTETMAATHINPLDRAKPQCLGVPVFDVDSRVIDPDTEEELGPGEIGEIVIHGPQVFLGYWNRPQDTEAAFVTRDGNRFFRSGDLGYYDEEGYFFLVDRLKRMINASGFKVWPSEVEAMIHAHPLVREACIISVPDPRRGETVKAVIVPAEGAALDPESLIAWCRERMAAYKVPRIVEFAEALPRSGSGKVLWRALQEQENARMRAAEETHG
jgi:fatty-acyl-CoA synthase